MFKPDLAHPSAPFTYGIPISATERNGAERRSASLGNRVGNVSCKFIYSSRKRVNTRQTRRVPRGRRRLSTFSFPSSESLRRLLALWLSADAASMEWGGGVRSLSSYVKTIQFHFEKYFEGGTEPYMTSPSGGLSLGKHFVCTNIKYNYGCWTKYHYLSINFNPLT